MKYPENYLTVQQGSYEWFQARCGCVTASRVEEAIRFNKNGKSSSDREKYKLELLAEYLTGQAVEHYVSPYMDWGTDNEPLARSAYEIKTGNDVDRIGYVIHPNIKRSGGSPDGLVGGDGIIEIKCPQITTHLKYLTDGAPPDEYLPQMMWNIACSGRSWCDFVSYHPALPEEYELFVVRMHRDDNAIGEMERQVEQFIVEVNSMAEGLLKYSSGKPKAAGPPRAEIPTFQ